VPASSDINIRKARALARRGRRFVGRQRIVLRGATPARMREPLPGRKKIFVLGSGRSGTHFLGWIVDAHPEIHSTIEDPRILDTVVTMAVHPRVEKRMFPALVRLYRREHGRVPDKHYADKTHPNIWIAERLADAFPEAVFLGIQREPFGTVASMLKHEGVRGWHEDWRVYPVPNRFLGITKELAARYDDLSLAEQCAVRWRSHAERMDELRERLGDRMWSVEYERLLTDTPTALAELQNFLGLATPLPPPELRHESLDKWRSQLTESDIAAIASVVGFDPPDAGSSK
jgi:hypothetical protein